MMTMTFEIWVLKQITGLFFFFISCFLLQTNVFNDIPILNDLLLLIEHFPILFVNIVSNFELFCFNCLEQSWSHKIHLTVTASTQTPLISNWRGNWMRQMLLLITFVFFCCCSRITPGNAWCFIFRQSLNRIEKAQKPCKTLNASSIRRY